MPNVAVGFVSLASRPRKLLTVYAGDCRTSSLMVLRSGCPSASTAGTVFPTATQARSAWSLRFSPSQALYVSPANPLGNGFTPRAALFGVNRICVAPSSITISGDASDTVGNRFQVAPPSVDISHLPVVSTAVMATAFGSPASASVTCAVREEIGAPAGNVPLGIGILIGGSIGVKLVSMTGRSGAGSTVMLKVSTAVSVPSNTVTV